MIERTVPLVEGNQKSLLPVIHAALKKFPQYRPRRRLLMEFLYKTLYPIENSEGNDEDEELQIDEYLQPTVFDCQSDAFSDLTYRAGKLCVIWLNGSISTTRDFNGSPIRKAWSVL